MKLLHYRWFKSFLQKLLYTVIFLCSMTGIPAETYLGGIWKNSLTIESIHNELTHRIDSHAVFQINSFADIFTLSSDISVYETFPNDGLLQPKVSVDSFKVEFYPRDFMTVSFGKYVYHLGQSEFFNPLYTFYQPDAAALFTGDIESLHHPELLTQLSLYTHNFSLNVTFSPFLPAYRPFPADSAWFPKINIKDIPDDFSNIGELTLGKIEYCNIESSKSSIGDEYSIQLEVSGVLPYLDWTLFWYSGWNRTFPLYQNIEIKKPIGDLIYDINLSPVYEKIDSFGISLSTVLSRTRFYFDALLTPESTFSTSSYSITGLKTKILTESAKNIRYTAGVSVDIYEFNMFIQAEHASTHIFEAEEKRIISPPFSHTLSGMIYISNNSRSIALNTISILSLHDFSLLLYPSVSLELSQEFSAGISTPFFFGRTTSEFGQYQNNRAVSITCTIRF